MPCPASIAPFRAHRPSAGDGEARADHCIKKGLPAGAGGAFVALALRLLESVVDSDGEGRMCLLGEAVHRLRHSIEKECFRFLLAAVTIGCSDQLLGLGHRERSE